MRALAYAAALHPGRRFRAAAVCRQAGVPEPFTRKVLHLLVESGLLTAHRGPGGGYALSRPPGEITLLEIVLAIDDAFDTRRCVMGFGPCGANGPCPLHHATERCSTMLEGVLHDHTLAQLVESVTLRERFIPTTK